MSHAILRSQRYPGCPSSSRLLAGVRAGNMQQRNQRITEARVAYGYPLKEIADFLGVHYTTISKAVGGRMRK
jgi:putative transposase